MKIILHILRILTGLLFVFSGFVKGVDPWGSAIKLHDYFTAFGWDFMLPTAFFLGSLMNVAEFVIGFSLLIGVRVRLASLGALLFMCIFTPLTFYLALFNPVSDCGCFGDAIKLSNWETFYKNIVITLVVVFVFIKRKQFRAWLKPKMEWLVVLVGILIITGIAWYSYSYLPIMDFLPYKKGNNIAELMKVPEGMPVDKYEQFITLNDTTNNTNIEVTVDQYSNDSTYWGGGTKYKYVSISEPKLVSKGYQPPIHDFTIVRASDQTDITQEVLDDPGYSLLMVSHKLSDASSTPIEALEKLNQFAMENNIRFVCMTSSTADEIQEFKTKYNPSYEFYLTDETTLKSMIRANPGLMLIKGATVIEKWSHNQVPSPEEFKQNFLK